MGVNADGNDHNCECSACAERYATLTKLHDWIVCHAIASPEDMAQSFPDVQAEIEKALRWQTK